MIINDFIGAKNTVNSILENLNEAKTIDLGGGSVAYQYNGKYYIKKGTEKKEISADQYSKLLSKDTSKVDLNNSPNITKDSSKKEKKEYLSSIDWDKVELKSIESTYYYNYVEDTEDGDKNVLKSFRESPTSAVVKSGMDSIIISPDGVVARRRTLGYGRAVVYKPVTDKLLKTAKDKLKSGNFSVN